MISDGRSVTASGDIASELLGRRRPVESLRTGEFWEPRDVSLEVRRGEALGLIGPNGAAKTTLLRLISGLINPDGVSLTVRGRVAPLISLGVGFNPVLTGAENIFVIMTILGLTKKEIDRRFAEIVDFAEMGDIDGRRVLAARSASRARCRMNIESGATKSAPTRSLAIAAKAPSNSLGPRASRS